VSRHTLSRQIRDSLVGRIVSGDIKPGERLVETRLAGTYGTSQAPVREALRELEAMRMVETRPRRGTFVRHFVQQTLRESYVVRAALEETATRLAMLAGTVPFDALHSQVEAMRAAARAADVDASTKASVAFHRLIVDAAQNELLKPLLGGTPDRGTYVRDDARRGRRPGRGRRRPRRATPDDRAGRTRIGLHARPGPPVALRRPPA
jgi:DNA-binding GntR family transcriptional regulator